MKTTQKYSSKNFHLVYLIFQYAIFPSFGKHLTWILRFFFAIMKTEQKICKKHKHTPKRRSYETIQYATAWEIFPHDFTYRIANGSWRGFVFSFLVSQDAHRHPCLCRKRACTAGDISVVSLYYHRF